MSGGIGMVGFGRAAAPSSPTMAGAHPGQDGDRAWQKRQRARRAEIRRLLDSVIGAAVEFGRAPEPYNEETAAAADALNAARAALGAAIDRAMGIDAIEP